MSGMDGLELLSGQNRKENINDRFNITYDRRGLTQGGKGVLKNGGIQPFKKR
jgi:hypothetical protein